MGSKQSTKKTIPVPSFGSDFNALFTLNKNVDNNVIAVGTGSFSCVFLCSRTGRYAQQCAVKHFDLETLHKGVERGEIDSKQLELSLNRTRRGLKVLMNYSGHQSFIQLLNIFDQPPNFLCSVMEYADGGELYDYITTRVQLQQDEAKEILIHITKGVSFLHQMGSVHRDIKPENICKVGDVWKLCDFGFARDFEDGNDNMNTLCGTKGYAAPEMFLGKDKDYSGKAIDVYSLGVVAYFMMGGYLPFKDGGAVVIFHIERWQTVTEIAKNFIKETLLHNPLDRLKSSELMTHEFLAGKDTTKK